MRFSLLPLLSLLALVACGGDDLYRQDLNGFDKGKRTFKMQERLSNTTLENGQPGYIYDTNFRWAVGNKANRSTVRKTTLNADYSLVKTEMTRVRDDETVKLKAFTTGSQIKISTVGGENPKNHELNHDGPIYLGFPAPMLAALANEMKAGETRRFNVLLDEAGEIKNIGLRFVGEDKVFRGGNEIQSYHFQQQAATAMEEWDDYFVNIATGDIAKINMGQIEFLPSE